MHASLALPQVAEVGTHRSPPGTIYLMTKGIPADTPDKRLDFAAENLGKHG
jgi:hypothetical protein